MNRLCGLLLVVSGLVSQLALGDPLEEAFAACREIQERSDGVACTLAQREPGLFDLWVIGQNREGVEPYILRAGEIAKTVCINNNVFLTAGFQNKKLEVHALTFECKQSERKLRKLRGWHVAGGPIT